MFDILIKLCKLIIPTQEMTRFLFNIVTVFKGLKNATFKCLTLQSSYIMANLQFTVRFPKSLTTVLVIVCRRRFLKDFTMNWHGGHVGYVTVIV